MTKDVCDSFKVMYRDKPECIDDCKVHKIIQAEENKKKFIIHNKSCKRILKIRIDGCIISDNSLKCDYLFVNCDDKAMYFVELKGSDLKRAIDQLRSTIELIKRCGDILQCCTVYAYVVLSRVRVPDVLEPHDVNFRKYLRGINQHATVTCTRKVNQNAANQYTKKVDKIEINV